MSAMLQQIGRYEIIRELGRGSMGIVYAAIDPLIGRMVAIKTIRLDEQGDTEARAELTRRLYREAQSAGILSHPGIITIHDVGERGNVAYIVMEYVDGTNLEEVLASGVPQHSKTLLSILNQAAAALDYAHDKGIIHRDIKPSNIMICRDGSVKIADFGVAKLSASTSMTQAGLVLGTPSYMSPEQAQGLTITGCSDQFSLAVVAYRVLTGTLPFQGPTLTALLTKILMEEPHYESAGLHAGLQPVFKKALAKDPAARFRNCAEFIRELESAYTFRPAQQPAGAPSLEQPEAARFREDESAPQPVAATELVDAPKRKSPLLAWGACLAVLALAAIGFFGYTALHKSGAAEPALQMDAAAVGTVKPTESNRAGAPQNERMESAQSNRQPIVPPPKSRPALSDEGAAAPAKTDAPLPNPAQTVEDPVQITTGTILWTGNLDRNSVLVITQRRASVGSVVGELPGVPVSLELDPADLVVRQMPGPENQWKQIILYSGPNKYRSITLYWKTLP